MVGCKYHCQCSYGARELRWGRTQSSYKTRSQGKPEHKKQSMRNDLDPHSNEEVMEFVSHLPSQVDGAKQCHCLHILEAQADVVEQTLHGCPYGLMCYRDIPGQINDEKRRKCV